MRGLAKLVTHLLALSANCFISTLASERKVKTANQTEAFPSWVRAERQLTWRSRCELVGSLQSCLEPNLSSEESRRWRIRALTEELKSQQGDGCACQTSGKLSNAK